MNRRDFLKTSAVLGGGLLSLRYPLFTAVTQDLTQFLIPPALQHVTQDSAILFFQLNTPQNGLVLVLQEDELLQEIPFSKARELITIEGLEPDTTYQYHVLVNGSTPALVGTDLLWESLAFHTQSAEENYPLTFVAAGDTGFGDNVTAQLAEQMAQHNPNFMLQLGDVVYHMDQHNNDPYLNWAYKYFAPLYPILQNVPIYPTFGNHELDAPARMGELPSYFYMFPPFDEENQVQGVHDYQGTRSWYSFVNQNILFISLNSQVFYSSFAEGYRAEQEAWLDGQLARTDALYKVVFFHVPPFTSSLQHGSASTPISAQWVPKFEQHGVALVVNGHAHIYERMQLNGVHYIIAGGGSAILYDVGAPLPQTVIAVTASSYPVFECYPDRIHLTAYTVNGEVIEEVDLPIG